MCSDPAKTSDATFPGTRVRAPLRRVSKAPVRYRAIPRLEAEDFPVVF